MDMNGYLVETLARQRLADLRAEARRVHQVRRTARRASVRMMVGRLLIRLGHRLEGGLHTARATA